MNRDAHALIEAYYAAFNEGDRQAMLDCLANDVVHEINQGSRETGKLAFARFLRHMDHCYREQVSELRVLTSPDDGHAAAEFVVDGTYLATDGDLPAATGQTYRLPAGAFFDIAEGAITRVTVYYNLEDWLRQIGAG